MWSHNDLRATIAWWLELVNGDFGRKTLKFGGGGGIGSWLACDQVTPQQGEAQKQVPRLT
jgi:hypothetical protein